MSVIEKWAAQRVEMPGLKEPLPEGLHCYELDLSGYQLPELPADLGVESRLILDNSPHLRRLPSNLKVGSLSLRNCPQLESLAEGLECWFLDLSGCDQFCHWPSQARIHSGSLLLRDCRSLKALPPWLGRLANLDLAGCLQIDQIPDPLQLTGWLDLAQTAITQLPSHLQDTPLRWRGVRIDARLAFRPESLTASEVLNQPNSELRRVMIERMGSLRFAQEAGAQVLDSDRDRGGPRQLLKIELQEDEPLVGLYCRCPSTAREYLLRVPPTVKNCHQAAAWIAGFDDPTLYHPDQES